MSTPLAKDTHTISAMFNHIAPRYDFLNQVMTGGLVNYWYRQLVAELRPHQPKHILDLATGTATFACKMIRTIPSIEQIIGADISEDMLNLAKKRLEKRECRKKIEFVKADATALPFPKESFDSVTCSLGIRNFPHLLKAFEEMYQVLQPQGNIFILELSQPRLSILKSLHYLYTHTMLPIFGKYIAHNKSAYKYLFRSIEEMPQYENLVSIIQSVGFNNVFYKPLSGGIATLFTATK